jgi:multidrug efflux pump
VLEDPAVENLSSFIGVDGTNTTLNSGRMLIKLKPWHDERDASATEVIRRLQARLAERRFDTRLYMQPVQDLSIEDRASRTQYQFSVESANAAELADWVPAWSTAAHRARAGRRGQRPAGPGLQAYIDIDRDSAGRLGITPAAIDNALYNAFGQRLMSTIFTQSAQYRVVLEVQPRVPAAARRPWSTSTCPAAGGRRCRCRRWRASASGRPAGHQHIGQFPAVTVSFNLAPGVALGDAVEAIRAAEGRARPAGQHRDQLPGRGPGLPGLADNTLLLILAAVVTMYIVLGVLYESYIHPVTILSTLPSAGVGALLALLVPGTSWA